MLRALFDTERYRLVAPDRPGYGGSESLQQDPLPPQAQAQWLHSLHQCLNVTRPVIVAQSISAAVALAFAARYPSDVAGLVLIAPFCRLTRPRVVPSLRLARLPLIGPLVARFVYPWLVDLIGPAMLARAAAPFALPRYLKGLRFREFVTQQALASMAAELWGFNVGMIAERTKLRHLQIPVIVLGGTADRTADCERHARWIARRLPHAHLREIGAAGHLLHHLVPDKVVEAVDELSQ